MKKRKKVLLGLLAATALLTLASCGSKKSSGCGGGTCPIGIVIR